MMKEQLTDRQQDILTFLEEFKNENGYPPTLRQIGSKFGISSTFGVKRHLDALEKKGYINVENNASRGISLVKTDEASTFYTKIPIIGRVAAGQPILAIENQEGELVLDPSMARKSADTFALKVKGDSMIEAGIFEDDVVIVSPNSEINNNDTAVAMINGEVTVKTFFRKNNRITLRPENAKYNPIEVNETDDFKMLGKVVAVLRWLS